MRHHPTRLLRNLLVCLLPILLATAAQAQVQIYAYFQGNPNGSVPEGDIDPQTIGENGVGAMAIALQSISFGAENSTTVGSGSGGAGTGTTKFSTLQLTKLVDKASPSIFSVLTTGQHITTMTVVFRKPVNGTVVTFMRMSFKLVFFTSSAVAADSGDSDLYENINLLYGAQQFTVYPIAPNGTLGAPVIQQWSQVLNQPVFEVQ